MNTTGGALLATAILFYLGWAHPTGRTDLLRRVAASRRATPASRPGRRSLRYLAGVAYSVVAAIVLGLLLLLGGLLTRIASGPDEDRRRRGRSRSEVVPRPGRGVPA
jgi:hypothetical protein